MISNEKIWKIFQPDLTSMFETCRKECDWLQEITVYHSFSLNVHAFINCASALCWASLSQKRSKAQRMVPLRIVEKGRWWKMDSKIFKKTIPNSLYFPVFQAESQNLYRKDADSAARVPENFGHEIYWPQFISIYCVQKNAHYKHVPANQSGHTQATQCKNVQKLSNQSRLKALCIFSWFVWNLGEVLTLPCGDISQVKHLKISQERLKRSQKVLKHFICLHVRACRHYPTCYNHVLKVFSTFLKIEERDVQPCTWQCLWTREKKARAPRVSTKFNKVVASCGLANSIQFW